MKLDLGKGTKLVKMARTVIENFVKNRDVEINIEDWMKEKRGVFTTLHTYPENELRGCIGLPYPDRPLYEALIEAARGATQDPRFPPLMEDELDSVVVEVSILSPPEEIKFGNPNELLRKIIPRKDGLILVYGPYSGLFLPQVWNQLKTKEEFLDHLCLKASLPPELWKEKKVKIYKFYAQIFKEKEPCGDVIEVKK